MTEEAVVGSVSFISTNVATVGGGWEEGESWIGGSKSHCLAIEVDARVMPSLGVTVAKEDGRALSLRQEVGTCT